jgi:hypothetical protein
LGKHIGLPLRSCHFFWNKLHNGNLLNVVCRVAIFFIHQLTKKMYFRTSTHRQNL